MTDATQPRLHPLADTSPSAVVAGFIAMMTGYTSSLVLMFQAGQAAGLTSGQISSWIWALSIGMAICSIGLSLRYRTPITHRLVNARRRAADYQFGGRQLPRGHRCVHHVCRAGDYLWGDREF